ncbi:unnamed protein product [Didymodactylos carnosus]|uniref:Vacuolar ATPase assembly integral membrane protein VMA21 homolog n=1 Tax=Didymodactylos carnosus TaxID=1234261 RepID=A0A814DQ07_9BILA|nr:unnamed protein product [Didymodactylos carnosus]CAF1254357.1 unnamed protein product [Didymodactylos carnosus]CAF3730901.1 unnamed protein product [Didymodactylos carnosus]CAF4061466.1 unnamed protein product [Didymodactylos carnosus]
MQSSTAITDAVILNNRNDESMIWTVFRKMLFFTILMMVAPLSSYFASKEYIFEGLMKMSNRTSYIYSVIVAVVVIHIILVAFLIVAFREEEPSKKKLEKKD